MRIMFLNHMLLVYVFYICVLKYAISSIIESHLENCKVEGHDKKFRKELEGLKKASKTIPTSKNEEFSRAKRSIASNYEDAHCLKNFETKDNAIIKTKESQANGAQYLNETNVATFEFCLRYCCETPLCNVAVYDIQVSIIFFVILYISTSRSSSTLLKYIISLMILGR